MVIEKGKISSLLKVLKNLTGKLKKYKKYKTVLIRGKNKLDPFPLNTLAM